MTWGLRESRRLAVELLGSLSARLRHVQGVAGAATEAGGSDLVVSAAWLHDIGYADQLRRSGMHAIDGAAYLETLGAPRELVSLVAFHTGAAIEAEERGLLNELLRFDPPAPDDLDVLTLADLTTSPTGERISFEKRLAEIFDRYDPQHPVHRAVCRSRASLEESCRRASAATGYPM